MWRWRACSGRSGLAIDRAHGRHRPQPEPFPHRPIPHHVARRVRRTRNPHGSATRPVVAREGRRRHISQRRRSGVDGGARARRRPPPLRVGELPALLRRPATAGLRPPPGRPQPMGGALLSPAPGLPLPSPPPLPVLAVAPLGMRLSVHQRLKARLPDGVLGLIYLGVYAAGRFFLSFYRTDPAVFAGLRQAQLASLLMVVIAAVAIPVLYWRSRNTGKPTVTEAAAV